MGAEQRSWISSDQQVTKRLFAILVLMIGLLCIFGGYLLGRMARSEVSRNNDLLTFNLTVAADALYKKATRITPKSMHHHDSEKIRLKLEDIFDERLNCGPLDKYHLAEYIKNSINLKVAKLMKSIYNASMYLDSLR